MSNYTTYSFQDVIISFECASVGAKSSAGLGVGSITIAMANEKTVHEVAADGSIMISKIVAENGTISISMQQTSQLHKYLLNWYNHINTSTVLSDWASMNITVSSSNLGESTKCTGVSPQKLPDKPYQSQGQLVTWALMAAEIDQTATS